MKYDRLCRNVTINEFGMPKFASTMLRFANNEQNMTKSDYEWNPWVKPGVNQFISKVSMTTVHVAEGKIYQFFGQSFMRYYFMSSHLAIFQSNVHF